MKTKSAPEAELDHVRLRFIRETEAALLIGLCHPERFPRIPTVRAGSGSFGLEFSVQFWYDAVGLNEDVRSEHLLDERIPLGG